MRGLALGGCVCVCFEDKDEAAAIATAAAAALVLLVAPKGEGALLGLPPLPPPPAEVCVNALVEDDASPPRAEASLVSDRTCPPPNDADACRAVATIGASVSV